MYKDVIYDINNTGREKQNMNRAGLVYAIEAKLVPILTILL